MSWLLPPTDNLHKFCAILGLMLMVGPTAGLIYLKDYTQELIDIAKLLSTKAGVETRHASDISYLMELRLKLMDAHLNKQVKQEDLRAFPSLDTLDNRIEKRKEQIGTAEILIAESRLANAKAEQFIKYSEDAYYPVLLFIFIGGQLAVFGFKGWARLSEHEKTQSLHD